MCKRLRLTATNLKLDFKLVGSVYGTFGKNNEAIPYGITSWLIYFSIPLVLSNCFLAFIEASSSACSFFRALFCSVSSLIRLF